MRRKDSTRRTLQLRRETLRNLRGADLARVAGGTDGYVDLTENCYPDWGDSLTMSTNSRFC